MMNSRTLVATFVFYFMLSQSSLSQALRFDGATIRDRCLQGECVQTVRATVDQVQRQNLSTAEFNSQLGAIAAVLFQTAQDADASVLPQLAEAMRMLALFTTDEEQRSSFVWVANQLSNGGGTLFDLEAPFAASPA